MENICQVCGHNLQRHVGFIDQAKLNIDKRVQLLKINCPHNVFDEDI